MSANKRNMTGAEMEAEVLAKIAAFSEENRPLAERIHQTIMEAAPSLHPRLWYGMPGYAKTKDSAVLVFFREDETYMTFGFTESVKVTPKADAGHLLMPCAWFFTDLDAATEQQIAAIVAGVVAD
ncbi:MAG TPA: hypothetical protein VD735_07780 [Candidatus Saccharimonadales bacterium]|nr:hypothetical protein [Candidatus Saccharimonadales bacterium]